MIAYDQYYALPTPSATPVPLSRKDVAALCHKSHDPKPPTATNYRPTAIPLVPTSSLCKRQAPFSANARMLSTASTDDVDAADDSSPQPATLAICPIPHLTSSLHTRYLTHSALPRAFELECQQPFGKNNINQSYTTDKTLHHVILIVLKSKFLRHKERGTVRCTCKAYNLVWHEWK
jgi:hypothetical protein